jgi:hypothetical protein
MKPLTTTDGQHYMGWEICRIHLQTVHGYVNIQMSAVIEAYEKREDVGDATWECPPCLNKGGMYLSRRFAQTLLTLH